LRTHNIEPRQLLYVYSFVGELFLLRQIVEIFITFVCGAAVVAACAVRRVYKLRSYDAIRKLNARSTARRRSTAFDVR
jgi:hypothetical protein